MISTHHGGWFLKIIFCLVQAGCFFAGAAWGRSPVTVTIGSTPSGAEIPSDFVGLSFGMKVMLPNHAGGHFFSPTNQALITLFQNLGIKHLRMGGTSVESPPTTAIPGEKEIDDLFAFARASGVRKIIYSLRLLENDSDRHYAATNAIIAAYIWKHYRANLDCFALGNEPDLGRVYHQDVSITNFSTYLAKWRTFAAAITNAVPEAKFAGPDGGSGNVSWTTRFARAEKNSGLLKVVTEHFYVGGAGRGVAAREGIERILSPGWLAANQGLYDQAAVPVLSNGLAFRFTEANDHYSGGVPDASDTFAGALWSLDFLHWWAAHGASGVDFHNTQWVVNDVITPGSNGEITTNPKGYGLKAFELGSQGTVTPITISNQGQLNLTAYAVRRSNRQFVTIINKEHGSQARSAMVTIAGRDLSSGAEVIYLTAPGRDVSAKAGVTLGGEAIDGQGPWRGKWAPLKPANPRQCLVEVPAGSAAIIVLHHAWPIPDTRGSY
jgi:hypothetical protein